MHPANLTHAALLAAELQAQTVKQANDAPPLPVLLSMLAAGGLAGAGLGAGGGALLGGPVYKALGGGRTDADGNEFSDDERKKLVHDNMMHHLRIGALTGGVFGLTGVGRALANSSRRGDWNTSPPPRDYPDSAAEMTRRILERQGTIIP